MQIMNYYEQILWFGALVFCVLAFIVTPFLKYSSTFLKALHFAISCLLGCLIGLAIVQFT